MVSAAKSPLEMFYHWEQQTPDKVYLRQPVNLAWQEFTWREVAELEKLLAEVNAEVPSYERVGQIYVTPEWTIENTLLTPTMKLKRNQIAQTYYDRIEQNLAGERVSFL